MTLVITEIIGLSLNCGEFPELLRHALVRPLPKKPKLDQELLQNYRPVSKCSLMSKLIEKAVCNQLHKYLFGNNLYTKCQSAHRGCHSTETLILRVHNDVMNSPDKRRHAILIMLDLTLIHAFVTSRMDYCNGLLPGLPSREIKRMQIIQNSETLFVNKTRKYDHMTPILHGLHWLPVHLRVWFKLICTAYKIIYIGAPTYLAPEYSCSS